MAHTENIKYLEQRLNELGFDVAQATEAVLSGGPGFALGFESATKSELNQVRTVLYSWLFCLGVKEKYAVKVKQSAVEVALKTPKVNFRGKFILGQAVGQTRMGSRSTVIMAEADTGDWDVMPDGDTEHERNKIMAILEGDDDVLDSLEENIGQTVAAGIKQQTGPMMPESYDPEAGPEAQIVAVESKKFVPPVGIANLDDEVIELD